MRLSEVERLTWEQVLLDKRHLFFPSAKTRELRRVPLLGGTDKLLAALPRTCSLVFPGFADRKRRAWAWQAVAVAAGLGYFYCRTYGVKLENLTCPSHGGCTVPQAKYRGPFMRFTRITAIRNLTNKNVPLARIMQMTGHRKLPTHMLFNVGDESDLDLIRKLYGEK